MIQSSILHEHGRLESHDFSMKNDHGHLTITIDNTRLDGGNSAVLDQITQPVMKGLKSITLNCQRVKIVDSGGLVGLVMLARKAEMHGLSLVRLKGLNPSVEKLIRLSHLEKHFDLPVSA